MMAGDSGAGMMWKFENGDSMSTRLKYCNDLLLISRTTYAESASSGHFQRLVRSFYALKDLCIANFSSESAASVKSAYIMS